VRSVPLRDPERAWAWAAHGKPHVTKEEPIPIET